MTRHRAEQRGLFRGIQSKRIRRLVQRQCCRRRKKLNARSAKDSIESLISKENRVPVDTSRQACSVTFSLGSTHFKNIGEVSVELKRKRESNRLNSIIANSHVFVATSALKELRSKDMHGPAGEVAHRSGCAFRRIDVGQVNREKLVVFSNHRAKQERLYPIESHAETRKVARLGVKKSKLRGAKLLDVAV